jgi:hypothetical protein
MGSPPFCFALSPHTLSRATRRGGRWRIGADEPAITVEPADVFPGDLEKAEQALSRLRRYLNILSEISSKGKLFLDFPDFVERSAIRWHRQWLWGQTRLDWFR